MTLTPIARRIAVAAAISTVGLAGLGAVAGPAGAETPPFEPGTEILAPEPTIPLPEPPVDPDLPLADACGQLPQGCEVPEPDPEPPVVPDLPLADPCGQLPQGCEQPDPDPEPPVDPDLPLADACGQLPQGCEQPDPDPGGGDPEAEPKGGDDGRSSLPRTGASLALLGGLGTALVGGGIAAKRAARR